MELSHCLCPISGAAAQQRWLLRHFIYLQSWIKSTYTEIRFILPRSILGYFGGVSTSKRVRSLSKGTHFSLSIMFILGLSQHSFIGKNMIFLLFLFIFYISKVKRKDSFAVWQSCNTDPSWLKPWVRMEMLKMSEHCRKHQWFICKSKLYLYCIYVPRLFFPWEYVSSHLFKRRSLFSVAVLGTGTLSLMPTEKLICRGCTLLLSSYLNSYPGALAACAFLGNK